MNHLAHFYLAGEDEGLSLGNYIADHIRGKQKDAFKPEIKKGIEMHRAIDSFTDNHELVKKAVSTLKPKLGRYSVIAIDVIYDHFLAKTWPEKHELALQQFANARYQLLENHMDILPEKSKRFYGYMKQNNILVNYKNMDALHRVFLGMSTRTRFPSKLHLGASALQENYEMLEQNFEDFFKILVKEFETWK